MTSFWKRKPPFLEDKDALLQAYNEVLNDEKETKWLILRYFHGHKIVLHWIGKDVEKFCAKCTERSAYFGYVRLEVESPENDSNDITNSKKAKFVLITWVGKHVDKELKQRVHGDRHCVKAVIQDYTCELFIYEEEQLTVDMLKREVFKMERKLARERHD